MQLKDASLGAKVILATPTFGHRIVIVDKSNKVLPDIAISVITESGPVAVDRLRYCYPAYNRIR